MFISWTPYLEKVFISWTIQEKSELLIGNYVQYVHTHVLFVSKHLCLYVLIMQIQYVYLCLYNALFLQMHNDITLYAYIQRYICMFTKELDIYSNTINIHNIYYDVI